MFALCHFKQARCVLKNKTKKASSLSCVLTEDKMRPFFLFPSFAQEAKEVIAIMLLLSLKIRPESYCLWEERW